MNILEGLSFVYSLPKVPTVFNLLNFDFCNQVPNNTMRLTI